MKLVFEDKRRMNEAFDYDEVQEAIQDWVFNDLISISTIHDEGYKGYLIKVNGNDYYLIQEVADYLEDRLNTKPYVNEDHEIEIWPD